MRLKIFLPVASLLSALLLGGGGFALHLRGEVAEQRESAADAASDLRDSERSIDALSTALKGTFDVPGQ